MIKGFSQFGYDGSLVNVEVDLRRGIPATDIVGLADGAVKESCERMRAAIRNSGFEYPAERVLISLSPADLKKEGAAFDLPIALGVLSAMNNLPQKDVIVMGELELSGNVRSVKAVYSALTTAISAGITKAIIPESTEAVPDGITVKRVKNLKEAYDVLANIDKWENALDNGFGLTYDNKDDITVEFEKEDYEDNFDKIEGHDCLKYAMAVAAAGRHNLLAIGGPGSGKTLILQNFPLLMPKLTNEEALSVNRIYSIAGLVKPNEKITRRPFRMPHQTASIEGVCGGGPSCRPGEISLAHNGVLFLDEAAEFRSSVLQMLRVPLEQNTICLSRAGRSTVYPAHFQLLMATNPCPCGNYGNKDKICLCSSKSIELYWRKFSAPLLDRLQIKFNLFTDEIEGSRYSLEELRGFISKAWKVQYKRQGKLNQDLDPAEVAEFIKLDKHADEHLRRYSEAKGFTPRDVSSVMKLARTLMDIHQPEEELINDVALCEALKLHGTTPNFL